MVDRERVAALLERLLAEVRALRAIGERPDAELRGDPHLLPAAKYRLIVAIEVATDVADHVIASEGLRASQSFADSFRSLEEGGWLPATTSSALQDTARFRNVLVHQYATVDDGRVVEILRTRLGDLEAFSGALAGRLEAG